MSFDFQTPAIHNVQNITASTQVVHGNDVTGKFACLHLSFHGDENQECEMEVYFPSTHIDRALAMAAAINALTPGSIEQAA